MTRLIAFVFPLLATPALAAEPAPAPQAPAAAKAPEKTAEPAPIPKGTKRRCPVSGERFTVTAKTPQSVYQGKRYAFCCTDCQADFEKDPAKYAR